MAKRAPVEPIHFDAVVSTVGASTIVRLPDEASKRLPSRGQVAVTGTVNGLAFETVVEPDGSFGHWIKVEPGVRERASLTTGETATMEIVPRSDWPEPQVPSDMGAALVEAPHEVRALWEAITPMARWEWVRWVNETRNPDTRRRRIQVTVSKMRDGKRRPCCFNLAGCTDPDLSRNGRLLEPG